MPRYTVSPPQITILDSLNLRKILPCLLVKLGLCDITKIAGHFGKRHLKFNTSSI